MKVTVVGAGAVGASCAEYIAMKDFASEVVLVDIKEGFAEGKAMDLMQTASLNGFDTKITGTTGDYSKTAGSKVAVITSGNDKRRIAMLDCKRSNRKLSKTFSRCHHHCGF
jgi:malate dehydrogenase